MALFEVKFEYKRSGPGGITKSSYRLDFNQKPSESEIILKLKSQNNIPKDADVFIKSIEIV